MKHILFVEDKPKIKLNFVLNYFENVNVNVNFTYEIKKSVNSALSHIHTHMDKIDLIVLDLGLPLYNNGDGYNELNGLLVLKHLLKKTFNIPVVINSTTNIPDEKNYLKPYVDQGANIQHVYSLSGERLSEFLKKI